MRGLPMEHITREGWLALELGSKPRAPSCASTDWASNLGNGYVKSSNYHSILSHFLSWLPEREQIQSQNTQFSCQRGPVAGCPKATKSQEPLSSCVVPRPSSSRQAWPQPTTGVLPSCQREVAKFTQPCQTLVREKNVPIWGKGHNHLLPRMPLLSYASFLTDYPLRTSHAYFRGMKKEVCWGGTEGTPSAMSLVVPSHTSRQRA